MSDSEEVVRLKNYNYSKGKDLSPRGDQVFLS